MEKFQFNIEIQKMLSDYVKGNPHLMNGIKNPNTMFVWENGGLRINLDSATPKYAGKHFGDINKFGLQFLPVVESQIANFLYMHRIPKMIFNINIGYFGHVFNKEVVVVPMMVHSKK